MINDTIADPKICSWVEIDVAYDTDAERAIEVIREESMKHPIWVDNRTDEDKANGAPPVTVRVIALGEYFVRNILISRSTQEIAVKIPIIPSHSFRNKLKMYPPYLGASSPSFGLIGPKV